MEPSVAPKTDVAPLIAPFKKVDQDLLGGEADLPFNTDDAPVPTNMESSIMSSMIDRSLTLGNSEISSTQIEPHLEKEIDLHSSKETKTFDPSSISVVKDFLTEARSEMQEFSDPVKEPELFGFNKPLPPEPSDTLDSVKDGANTVIKNSEERDNDVSEFVGAAGDASPVISREDSPIPPPIPKHQNLRDESPDRFESSPEPDFKPMEPCKDEEISKPRSATPPKQEEIMEAPKKEIKNVPKKEDLVNVGDIGVKDIIVEIDAWFNPARLHPQVESLVYWRDPKKSGAVFGFLMVTLFSLTCFSFISVLSYLGLLTLAGTISFRIYKNIMQAVQKTSDGHPFKEYLEMEISLPEDKVAETSRIAAHHINAAISALRSLFLVEDLVDSIKALVLFWTLTYVGALFNGLTLLIIGVILIFSLPRLYEKNKAQVDAYIQIGMDKLSVITNRMKAAIPSGKKEEKPKDQ